MRAERLHPGGKSFERGSEQKPAIGGVADAAMLERGQRLSHEQVHARPAPPGIAIGRKDRLQHGPGRGGRSEEHTSELQSLMRISYAVFCLKKKTKDLQDK